MHQTSLCNVPIGNNCTVVNISNHFPLKRRLQDLGFTPGTKVECLFKSPLGDPTAYRIKNTTIALRFEDSSMIIVDTIPQNDQGV